MSEVRIAGDAEVARVAAVLARAFFDDRIYRWVEPDDAQRRTSASAFFDLFARACAPHGAVQLAAGAAGAALWLPPGCGPVDPSGDLGARVAATAGGASSAARMAALAEAQDADHPAEPSWYLAFMGVDPDRQGTGVGSSMLAAALARVDADGAAAYLEASCPDNQRLYERHGFVTTGEIAVLDAPSLFPMWRTGRSRG